MSEDLSRIKLDQILDEIAGFEVKLEDDPTKPQFGAKYLQESIAKCRSYLNRVQYYLQIVKKRERDLRIEVKQTELDFEFKMQDKLANDAIVRQQPSEGVKKAVATAFLKDEHERIAQLKVELMDVQETAKIIKMKYDDLQKTNQDIKFQRQLVKDDRLAQASGEGGYTSSNVDEKGRYQHGLTPPVTQSKIDPTDLLDPDKRPDDLPAPVSKVHAEAIADFLNKQEAPKEKTLKYDDLLD